MKSKYSKAKRTIISAISLLAVSSAFIAPAYYDTDVFCSITASAADTTSEEYFDFSDGVINGFSDKGKAANITKLVIPEKIGGAAVTSIGTDAFYGCDSLTEITIPSGVTSIGDNAFHDCYSLTKITLPSGITSIGNGAFCNCTSLTEITLPNGITSINNEVFSGCESLTEIKIPDNVASIGIYAFSDCKGLTEITIPSGVTSIDGYAFARCKNLESVKFLSDVPETLELGIFSECGGITLTVPQEYFTNWQKKTETSHFHLYSAFFDANIVVVPDETESSGLMGDANCDNKVNMADVVLIMQSIANPDKYGITGSDPSHITSQGTANSDVTAEKDGLTNMDALVIQKYLLGVLKSLPETEA